MAAVTDLSKAAHRRAIIAAGIGNCLALFDLTVFGFFAASIGAQFVFVLAGGLRHAAIAEAGHV